MQADTEGSVSRLVSKVGAEAVEMAYWLVKFVGDFEKVFEANRDELYKNRSFRKTDSQ